MRSKISTRSGFTLVELLVVMIIIAVLITITLVIGARVRTNGRESVTRDTIKILDNALTALQASTGELPKPLISVGANANAPDIRQVIVDAPTNPSSPRESSCGWFVYQASKNAEANALLSSINAKYVATFDSTVMPEAPGFRVINDGFGNPIRYVHPAFQGVFTGRDPSATFGAPPAGMSYRPTSVDRSSTGINPNSDGGQCAGNRPYFYSCGADGKADTRDDNVYSESGKPNFVDN